MHRGLFLYTWTHILRPISIYVTHKHMCKDLFLYTWTNMHLCKDLFLYTWTNIHMRRDLFLYIHNTHAHAQGPFSIYMNKHTHVQGPISIYMNVHMCTDLFLHTQTCTCTGIYFFIHERIYAYAVMYSCTRVYTCTVMCNAFCHSASRTKMKALAWPVTL